MRPQCIDQLGTLAHQQIARSMLHQPALLLGRLDPHKAYGRTSDRLADRLGVGGIVLVALDVSLYILRRHQTNLVTELRQLACPWCAVAQASMPRHGASVPKNATDGVAS